MKWLTTTTNVIDSGASYVSVPANTIRQARASAGNQVQFVSGLAEDGIHSCYSAQSETTNVSGAFASTGVGLDSTSTFVGQPFMLFNFQTASGWEGAGSSCLTLAAQVGLHTISANEEVSSTANTMDVGGTNTLSVDLRAVPKSC
jgi:hypothetical protein